MAQGAVGVLLHVTCLLSKTGGGGRTGSGAWGMVRPLIGMGRECGEVEEARAKTLIWVKFRDFLPVLATAPLPVWGRRRAAKRDRAKGDELQ